MVLNMIRNICLNELLLVALGGTPSGVRLVRLRSPGVSSQAPQPPAILSQPFGLSNGSAVSNPGLCAIAANPFQPFGLDSNHA